MSDQDHDDFQEEARDLLSAIEQVEETLAMMTTVVGQLPQIQGPVRREAGRFEGRHRFEGTHPLLGGELLSVWMRSR